MGWTHHKLKNSIIYTNIYATELRATDRHGEFNLTKSILTNQSWRDHPKSQEIWQD